MLTKSNIDSGSRSDEDIARDIRRGLKLDNDVPDKQITVQVHVGVVTLEGGVSSRLQQELAEADARKVKGVTGVINRIELQPEY